MAAALQAVDGGDAVGTVAQVCRIVDFLKGDKSSGTKTISEIAAGAQLPAYTTRRRLEELEAEGWAWRYEVGKSDRWGLTEGYFKGELEAVLKRAGSILAATGKIADAINKTFKTAEDFNRDIGEAKKLF